MKVGILTFHRALNYGAVLQCYALQEVLRSMGHEVEIIDYIPNVIKEVEKSFSMRRCANKGFLKFLPSLLLEFLSMFPRNKRLKNFNSFLSKKINIAEEQSVGCYDAVIVGSDQVWNVKMLGGFDEYYWNAFNIKSNWIAYAASLGDEIITDRVNEYIKYINGFSHVSLRENNAVQQLKNIGVADVVQVVDPTLLVDSDFWCGDISSKTFGDYILVYLTKNSDDAIKLAKKKASETGYKIIRLEPHSSFRYYDNKYQSVGPDVFLELFMKAKYVVTTSFHGTVFSVIFKRPFSFVRIESKSRNMRSEDLLKTLKLESRIFIPGSDNDTSCNIDWDPVGDVIKEKRRESFVFLDNALRSSSVN